MRKKRLGRQGNAAVKIIMMHVYYLLIIVFFFVGSLAFARSMVKTTVLEKNWHSRQFALQLQTLEMAPGTVAYKYGPIDPKKYNLAYTFGEYKVESEEDDESKIPIMYPYISNPVIAVTEKKIAPPSTNKYPITFVKDNKKVSIALGDQRFTTNSLTCAPLDGGLSFSTILIDIGSGGDSTTLYVEDPQSLQTRTLLLHYTSFSDGVGIFAVLNPETGHYEMTRTDTGEKEELQEVSTPLGTGISIKKNGQGYSLYSDGTLTSRLYQGEGASKIPYLLPLAQQLAASLPGATIPFASPDHFLIPLKRLRLSQQADMIISLSLNDEEEPTALAYYSNQDDHSLQNINARFSFRLLNNIQSELSETQLQIAPPLPITPTGEDDVLSTGKIAVKLAIGSPKSPESLMMLKENQDLITNAFQSSLASLQTARPSIAGEAPIPITP